MPEFSRNLAVVIGINQYQNGISSLQSAVNDAKELARILREAHGYQVRLLLNQEATLRNLNYLLEEILKKEVGSDDRLLFYFAGHGIALSGDDGPEGYVIPQDAQVGIVSSYLPMPKLHAFLAELHCRHFLAILDCCFAGAFRWSSTRDVSTVPEVIHKERYDRFIQDPAWQVISSAAYDQRALDVLSLGDQRGNAGQHSPFASSLFAALQGKADTSPPAKDGKPPGDGIITATELYLYLRDSLEPVTEEQYKRQTPGLWSLKKHDKGEYIFVAPGRELNLPPAPPLDESKNPYRGLESFEEEHSEFFFGRTALIEKLHEFIDSHPLTVVLGASGSGKSSLVKAGLIPHLKHQDKQKWRILAPIRPGESPLGALNKALIRGSGEWCRDAKFRVFPGAGSREDTGEAEPPHPRSQAQPGNELIEAPPRFGNGARSELKTLATSVAAWSRLYSKGKLLLAIDQFEELVTLCAYDQERREFLAELFEAITAYPEQLRIVLTLRSDFEPQFRDTVLEPYWTAARFVVPSMTREELRACIEEPATLRVMYFEPYSLVDQLIDEVAQMPGALPLLSFTLSELYLKYVKSASKGKRNNRAITQEDYEELGGVTRSLTQRADQEYEALVKRDSAYAQTIRHIMLRMVAVSGGELARRRVPLSELEYPEPENKRVQEVIGRFSSARLLIGGTDASDQPYVEPAHDALVRGWQKLLFWKKEEQESLILQRRITPAAFEWKSKQQVQFLWNADPRLDLLQQVLTSDDNWFNRVETEFVQRSVRQKRKNVVLRWSIVASALTVLTGITFYALVQGQNSRLRETAAVVENIESVKPLDALVRAVDASDQWLAGSVPEVWSSLLSAIEVPKERTILRVPGQSLVTSVAVLSDGRIVSGTDDGTLILWDMQGNQIAKSHSIGAAINSLAACPKAPLVVLGSGDGTISLWHLHDRAIPQIIGQEDGNSALNAVAFSPDCQTILAGSNNGVQLWNQQGNPMGNPFRYPGGIATVAFSPDGQLIVGGSQDGNIFLWDARGNWTKRISFSHPRGVNAVAFSPDSQLIISGGNDGILRLWDRDGKQVGNAFRGHENRVTSVAFSSNGQFIVSGSHDNSVRLWDLEGNQLGDPLQGHESWIRAVAISQDGHSIVSGSNDSTIRLWDVKSDLISHAFQGYEGRVWGVALSADGQLIASGDEQNGTVRLWDRQGKPIGKPSVRHQGSVWAIAMTDDGQTIVSGGKDGTIRLWDSLGNQIGDPFKVKDSRIGVDTFSPYTFSPYAQSIDIDSSKSFVVGAVAISPDGQVIASSSNDAIVRLWDRQGKLIREFPKMQALPKAIAFSPNGQLIATGSNDARVRLWDRQGKLIREFPKIHTLPIESIAFSWDGQLIASGSQDNTMQLWSVDSGMPSTQRFRGHYGWVSAIAFSRDNQFIATGSWDKTVRLWDRNGNPMGRPFRGHNGWISAVRFSFDGQSIISGSADRTVRLWQGGDRQTWLQVACSQLRNHPVFNKPETSLDTPNTIEVALGAKRTCQE